MPPVGNWRVFIGILLVSLTAAGCVTPTAGRGVAAPPTQATLDPVPNGSIDEPALTWEKLRQIDVCGLLDDRLLARLGERTGAPVPDDQNLGIGGCRQKLTESGGEPLTVDIVLGADLTGGRTQVRSGLEGLPMYEAKTEIDGVAKCTSHIFMDDKDEYGAQISVERTKTNASACQASRTVSAKTLRRLKDDPPRLDLPRKSVLRTDACSMLDSKSARSLLKADPQQTRSLHGCRFGAEPSLGVVFEAADPRSQADKTRKLTEDVKAEVRTEPGRCTLSWQRDSTDEWVSVSFAQFKGATESRRCAKAATAARKVLKKLPTE